MTGNQIKEWLLPQLKKRNLSIKKFALKCGISRATIYTYMRDRNRPEEETMALICKALSETPYWQDGKEVIDKVTLADGLAQYEPRKAGRPRGSTWYERETEMR